MFKGTFDALAKDEVVALFPEGTSYTEPRIMQVKDGAAWAALEYMKWAESEEGKKKDARPLAVVPAGLVYTNKSKYRSSVVMEYVPSTLTYELLLTAPADTENPSLLRHWPGTLYHQMKMLPSCL